MRKVFVCIMIVLMVVPFWATSVEADFTLSFEGKASIAGYREVGSPLAWNIIRDCNVSFKFYDWISIKGNFLFCYRLRGGEFLINGSNGNYTYNDGAKIMGFLLCPNGLWTIGSNHYK